MLIEGRQLASEINERTKAEIERLNLKLHLAMVMVGGDASSRNFLELKAKAAKTVGIETSIHEFDGKFSTKILREKIVDLAGRPRIDAVIVELPLPEGINTQYVLNGIPLKKDADVLCQQAQGAFFAGRSTILPPAVEALKIIIEKYGVKVSGLNCAVFGYGLLVGKPVAHWLISQGATVSIINEFTHEPAAISSQADLLVSGVGRGHLITAGMVKEGSVVVDYGFDQIGGSVVGDVDFENVSEKAKLITPVPGGVGPLVVAAVLKNVVDLNK